MDREQGTVQGFGDLPRVGRRIRPREIVAAALIALIGAAGWYGWGWLTAPGVLPIRVVKVMGGGDRLDPRDLEQAIAERVQGGFFTVDLKQVQDAALGVPWVGRVGVRRIWPDTLVVQVEEKVPLARWGAVGLVTAAGVVFTPRAEEIPLGLPQLAGPKGREAEVIGLYLELRPRLRGLGLDLDEVRLDGRRAWTMGFADGMRLKVGRNDVEARIERFIRVFPAVRAERPGEIEQVDLRYTTGLAVRRGAPTKTQGGSA